MKYQINEPVLFNDEKHTIYDYNARYKEYTLLNSAEVKVYNVQEKLIDKLDVKIIK